MRLENVGPRRNPRESRRLMDTPARYTASFYHIGREFLSRRVMPEWSQADLGSAASPRTRCAECPPLSHAKRRDNREQQADEKERSAEVKTVAHQSGPLASASKRLSARRCRLPSATASRRSEGQNGFAVLRS